MRNAVSPLNAAAGTSSCVGVVSKLWSRENAKVSRLAKAAATCVELETTTGSYQSGSENRQSRA